MPTYTDQAGRTVVIESIPRAIVSLVPSQTELLFSLGLGPEVAGITKFCVHPDHWFRTKTRIGGTKNVNIETIKGLHPDLIIANKEENVREQVEELARHFPVWTSDVNDLPGALDMIRQVGLITGKAAEGEWLAKNIQENFNQLESAPHPVPAAYLIWREPYMAAGGDTFIHHMLRAAGLNNIFADRPRYPIVTIDDLRDCPLILLSSEPYPFRQKHIEELLHQLPDTTIALADGELFSWYGSRLLHAPPYFRNLRKSLSLSHGTGTG